MLWGSLDRDTACTDLEPIGLFKSFGRKAFGFSVDETRVSMIAPEKSRPLEPINPMYLVTGKSCPTEHTPASTLYTYVPILLCQVQQLF